MAKAYVQQTQLQWPLLVDRTRQVYDAYQMLHGTWWDIASPGEIWKYLKLIFKGQRLSRPGDDWLQMGGDVMIDDSAIVRFHHVSRTPHDRPEIERLLQVARTK